MTQFLSLYMLRYGDSLPSHFRFDVDHVLESSLAAPELVLLALAASIADLDQHVLRVLAFQEHGLDFFSGAFVNHYIIVIFDDAEAI